MGRPSGAGPVLSRLEYCVVMRLARSLPAMAVAGLLAAHARGQDPPRVEPPPTFSSEVEVVVVDVVVTARHGAPLPDLRREEFTVTEDGVPQQVQTFEVVDAVDPAPAEADQ